jgi:thiol-disulfide isomerase/thioredoxin
MKILFCLFLFSLISLSAYAEKIPDFTLLTHPANEKFHLQEKINGKKIVINFWASWCPSCTKEVPELEALKAKYGHDVVFIAVNAGENTNSIDQFIQKTKYSFILLKDEGRIFTKSIGVVSIPITIVIDKDRNIVYRGTVPPKEL